jgi:hypothetical protein
MNLEIQPSLRDIAELEPTESARQLDELISRARVHLLQGRDAGRAHGKIHPIRGCHAIVVVLGDGDLQTLHRCCTEASLGLPESTSDTGHCTTST